jgi:hypothetical protein
MTALAETNVLFSRVDTDYLSVANKMVIGDLTFGNSALTYPTGGIPVATSVGKFGFNKTIKFVQISEPSDAGYIYRWTYSDSAPKVRIYQSSGDALANHTHTVAAHVHTLASHTHQIATHTHNISIASATSLSAVDTYAKLSAIGVVFAQSNTLKKTVAGAAQVIPTAGTGTISTSGTATLSSGQTTLTTAGGGAATADPSAMTEMTTGYAPAATTLRLMMLGE